MSHPEAPLAVVVIPFEGWNPLVEDCVRGCSRLDHPRFRIALVTSHPEQVPAEVLDGRVVVLPASHRNISGKRNLALESFPEASWFAFIDSDARPRPDWLSNAVAALADRPDLAAVGGPDVSPDYEDRGRQGVADALRSPLVSGPRTFLKTPSPARLVEDLRTCNMVVSAEALARAGRFDESLEVGEDSELCCRLQGHGYRLLYRPDVVVYHHCRPLLMPFLKQKITAGYGVVALLKAQGTNMSPGAKAFRFLPVANVLFLGAGWVPGLFCRSLLALWLAALLGYAALVTLEALRIRSRGGCVARTALALAAGNLGPGMGTLLALGGGRLKLRAFYRNDEGAGVSRRGPGAGPG